MKYTSKRTHILTEQSYFRLEIWDVTLARASSFSAFADVVSFIFNVYSISIVLIRSLSEWTSASRELLTWFAYNAWRSIPWRNTHEWTHCGTKHKEQYLSFETLKGQLHLFQCGFIYLGYTLVLKGLLKVTTGEWDYKYRLWNWIPTWSMWSLLACASPLNFSISAWKSAET